MSSTRNMTAKLAVLAGFAIAFVACGYHISGRTNTLPAQWHVLTVLPFENHTLVPTISQTVTTAVADELARRTHYRVQPEVAGSDGVLHGSVLSVQSNPVTFDPQTGHATTGEVTMHIKVWLTDSKTDQELFLNGDMVFHDQYQISSQATDFFEEQPLAYQRMSRTIARTLVSTILENF